MAEIVKYIQMAASGTVLSVEDVARAFQIITMGGASPAQIASFLTSLHMRGETVEELLGAAKILIAKSKFVDAPEDTIDVCKVSREKYSLNVYTAASLVLAGCGVPVAKHGDKTQIYISAGDVFESLGVNIKAGPRIAEQALRAAKICYMNTVILYPGTRDITSTQCELEIASIWDLIMPLANPANPRYRLIGVPSPQIAEKLIYALKELGCKRAWVVNGEDGLSKLTVTADNHVWELKDGNIQNFKIKPSDLGLESGNKKEIQGGDLDYNVERLKELLQGKKDTFRNIVILNAAAGLVVAEKTNSLHAGLRVAADSIDSGRANQALKALIEITNQ